jgi:hypothetical protein
VRESARRSGERRACPDGFLNSSAVAVGRACASATASLTSCAARHFDLGVVVERIRCEGDSYGHLREAPVGSESSAGSA